MATVIPSTSITSIEVPKHQAAPVTSLQGYLDALSSGRRPGSARDDTDELSICDSMGLQVRNIALLEGKANDAISMAQTADAALSDVHSLIGRMREIAMQSANPAVSPLERRFLQAEFDQLKSEVAKIQASTNYRGRLLLDPYAPSTVGFQPGVDDDGRLDLRFGEVSLADVTAGNLAVTGAGPDRAQQALAVLDDALGRVSQARAGFGERMRRLDAAVSGLRSMRRDLDGAADRIADTDVARAAAESSRDRILARPDVSIRAQANAAPGFASVLLG